MNASGQVAFFASLTGGSANSGVFVGTPASIQAVALQGSTAPAGGSYGGFGSPVLNAAGQVAFSASLTGGSSTVGIFAGPAGSVQAVAMRGSAPPAGGNYNGFGNPVLTGSGQVAFEANLTGGSATRGIFVGAPGSLQAAALQGNPAPAGGSCGSLGTVPLLNNNGRVAFTTFLTGGSSTQGIFAGAPGSLQPVALQGGSAPAGGTFSNFGTAAEINASGEAGLLCDTGRRVGGQRHFRRAP